MEPVLVVLLCFLASVLIPMPFMLVSTVTAVILKIRRSYGEGHSVLLAPGSVILIMAVWPACEAAVRMKRVKAEGRT